ncbi:hypothetical protein [uncultured Fusobacterium sp.]|uniref:hypothetical protein n=1 Tax=uncultured Fusobacterium sp. TaxID=159267 RepID=UPI0025E6022A|nr:hypothetical protein [uncultured Fusobacterium sp.]
MEKQSSIIKHYFDEKKNKVYTLSLENGEYIVRNLNVMTKRLVQHFFYKDEKKANKYFEKIIGGKSESLSE